MQAEGMERNGIVSLIMDIEAGIQCRKIDIERIISAGKEQST